MNLLVVDDERLALQLLTDTIQKVLPDATICAFTKRCALRRKQPVKLRFWIFRCAP